MASTNLFLFNSYVLSSQHIIYNLKCHPQFYRSVHQDRSLQFSKTVAVVPQSWYSGGGCVWPDYPRDERVDKAVRSAEEPQPDWQTHYVRIIRSCDDYLVARRWLTKYMSCDTSDLHSEEEAIPKRRKPMPVHFFGDSDADSETENRHPKKKKGPTTSRTVAPPPTIAPPPPRTSSPAGQRTSHAGYTPTWRGARCGSDTIACCAAQVQMMAMLETLTQQVHQLTQQVHQLTSKIDSFVRPSVTQMSGQEVEWRDPFPLTTMEEVDMFEQQLKDPANALMKKSDFITSRTANKPCRVHTNLARGEVWFRHHCLLCSKIQPTL
ncbi:uncharacterized protein LOC130205324 isoform X2 [Pseudoliparis swirei]|uniref:uncharacterized protein LOC130205324 isoform X2 n=1 Tax=Pseudoliparis swirei TaxID=2059687 RepID=UPI0024BD940A|nr:uncharacterized protein LOC130205324 isoform X2 [Pseudoliparis swirei]